MAVASARNIVSLKENGHFEHKNENDRIEKYTLADELPARLSGLQIRRTIMKPSYTLRTITADDETAVLDFLYRFFFRDEPMNQAVNLLTGPGSRCEELEKYSISTLHEGYSFAAVDDNGDFVGIILNGVVKRENAEFTDKSESCPNKKFRRILKVLGHLEQEGKVWEKVPATCTTIMEVRIASTHSEWRGKGLMRILCEETEKLAKQVGAGALRMDATSMFSAAAAERLGFEKVYSVLYKDLPYAPQPQAPHLEARVYVKEV